MLFKNEGFTLVELMVVIVIIGILAALAIPKFMEASLKAKISDAPVVIATCEHAILASLSETGLAPTGWGDLIVDDPSGANYSKWYAYTGGWAVAGPTTITASPKAALGIAGNLVSSITNAGVITHTRPATYDKYLPNF